MTPEELEAQKGKAEYDVNVPKPSMRLVAECYLTTIASENPFLATLFQERSTGRARTLLGPQVVSTADTVRGPESDPGAHMIDEIVPDAASVLARIGALLLLHMPTADRNLLEHTQQAAKHIADHPYLQKELTQAYAQIKEVEGSALHLYRGLEDPLWSIPFQKKLASLFINQKGKFVSSLGVELGKRFFFDGLTLLVGGFSVVMLLSNLAFFPYTFVRSWWRERQAHEPANADMQWFLQMLDTFQDLPGRVKGFFRIAQNVVILFGTMYSSYQTAEGQALSQEDINTLRAKGHQATWGFISYSLILLFACVWGTYQAVMQRLIVTSYVAKRLEAFAQLVRSARQIDLLIQRDPVLAPLLGKHLQHTRALLAGRHPDPAVNRLAKTLATYPFGRWHLLLSSTGTLLTTMTALQEHLEAFKPMLMELAWMRNYLTAAQLAQRHSDQANGYTFTRFLGPSERAGLYIALQKGWNPALEPSKAVPNDFLIDAQQANTMVLTGPNACGKSAYGKMVLKNLLLMHTFTLAAASKAALTPLSLINSFKEPEDDINRQLSLFAMEMRNVAWQHQALSVLSQGQHAFTLYDEFLSSTNPVEGSALNYACIKALVDKYPNHANVVVTHNSLLAGLAKINPRVRSFQAVIERHADGSYTRTFLIRPGSSHERVGIDLAARELKNPFLIEKARKVAREMRQEEEQTAEEILRRRAQQAA